MMGNFFRFLGRVFGWLIAAFVAIMVGAPFGAVLGVLAVRIAVGIICRKRLAKWRLRLRQRIRRNGPPVTAYGAHDGVIVPQQVLFEGDEHNVTDRSDGSDV
jgi:hypothetical protein